ncbi:MAG: 7-carboxy-7-deazaguanine synthase QueE [Candidatus Firestonebacteria bacterium]
MQNNGYITEIFSSFQGEGIYLGVKQIFIRFSGCNLRCKFCDTKYSLSIKKRCKVYKDSKDYYLNNPIEVKDVMRLISCYKNDFHSVSLTGGEPLAQIEYLEELIKVLKKKRIKVYLDTNGTLVDELKRIIKNVDIISMDIKLPSSTGLRSFWNEHTEFLKISKKKVFVKVVITENTLKGDMLKAVSLIKGIDESIPFVIQIDSNMHLEKFFEKIKKYYNLLKLKDIRVIPQIHKYLKIK